MNKIRINVLARELEIKAQELIDKLPELGVTEKKTHSSSVDEDVAEKLRRVFAGGSAEPAEVEKCSGGRCAASARRSGIGARAGRDSSVRACGSRARNSRGDAASGRRRRSARGTPGWTWRASASTAGGQRSSTSHYHATRCGSVATDSAAAAAAAHSSPARASIVRTAFAVSGGRHPGGPSA